MRAEAIFLIRTVTFWIGLGCALRAIWLLGPMALKPPGERVPTLRAIALAFAAGYLAMAVAAGLPASLRREAPSPIWLPLVWPVMPFPGWILVVAVAMLGIRSWEVTQALNSWQRRRSFMRAGAWALFVVANLVWWQLMQTPLQLLRGAIPLSPEVIGTMVSMALALWLIVNLASRHLPAKNIAKTGLVYLAMIFGSALFCLPLVWLLLTSFKERDDNTAAKLVWVPRVTEQHSYFDKEQPLFSTTWEGKRVVVRQVGANPDGTWQLDIERPYPLKGWRVTARQQDLKPEPRKGIVVKATYQATPVKGFVRKDLVGGEREIEILTPTELKGRVFTAQTSETTPVRHVGVRTENYTEALEWLPPETQGGLVYLRNTLWIVVMSTLGTILSCSLVAYGFSRVRFPGRSALFAVMLATMMLPGAVTMLPRFLVWRGLGAIDTLVPIWLPTFTASAFFVFLLREFFKTLPKELEDAAKIDGCNPLQTYWKVMMPQIKPALTVIGIWTFMGAWNDFMSPLIYVSSSEKMPISYAIQLFSVDKGGEFGLMMAFATMATIPVLIVFLIGQRYFVEGVQLSGLGGK